MVAPYPVLESNSIMHTLGASTHLLPMQTASYVGMLHYTHVNHMSCIPHLIPTSSIWVQLCCPIGLAGQSMSLASVPAHSTPSNQITSIPLVKPVVRTAAPRYMQSQLTFYKSNINVECRMEYGMEYELKLPVLGVLTTRSLLMPVYHPCMHNRVDIVIDCISISMEGQNGCITSLVPSHSHKWN